MSDSWLLRSLAVAGPVIGLVAMFTYPLAPGHRHLDPRLLLPWTLRLAGQAATAVGLAAVVSRTPNAVSLAGGALVAVVVDQTLAVRIGTDPMQRSDGRWLVLRGIAYVIREPRAYLGFRRAGLRLFGHAYLAARKGSPEQWRELGWDARARGRVLGLDRHKVPMIHPIWKPYMWPRWSLTGLATVSAVTGDGPLAGLPDEALGVLSTGAGPALAVGYLTSPHAADFAGDGFDRLIFLVRTGLPYPVFAELAGLLGPGGPAPELGPVPGARMIAGMLADAVRSDQLAWDEVPGWVRHDPAGVRELVARYRRPAFTWAEDFSRLPARQRWIRWHEVSAAMGPGAAPPAVWHGAGFGPEEALRLWTSGQAPDADTLAAMAALRREP